MLLPPALAPALAAPAGRGRAVLVGGPSMMEITNLLYPDIGNVPGGNETVSEKSLIWESVVTGFNPRIT
jgi:hypothetical protein